MVRRAIDLSAGIASAQVVAVKIIKGAEADARRRFLREYRVLRDHPHAHVVPVIAYGEQDGLLWYAMPLATQSLEKRLAGGVLTVAEALPIVRQVSAGVAHLHEVGVIHRDIKPANVLDMGPKGWVISDLGLALRSEAGTTSRLTESGVGFGSFWYGAPEQWGDAHHATVRSDIFSLGRLTQEVLLGYESEIGDLEHETVRAVLRRATANDSNARHKSVASFLAQFEAAAVAPSAAWTAPEPWSDRRERLLRELRNATPDASSLEEIRLLVGESAANLEVMEQFESVFVMMSADLIVSFWTADESRVRSFLDAYADHVANAANYDFGFTDVVADFWHRCALVTRDPQIRAKALAVLGQLGPRYNRWRVREVFAAMLQEVQSGEDATYSEEPLRQLGRSDLEWSIAELDLRTLHPMLQAAITDAIADHPEP